MKFTELYRLQEDKIGRLNNRSLDLTDTQRDTLKKFYKENPRFDDSEYINWQKKDTLTWENFQKVLDSFNNKKPSKSQLKKSKKEEIKDDIKNLFNRKDVFIQGEDDNFIFVSPLTWEAAKWMDSVDCGYAGATWCIGWEKNDEYWKKYLSKGYAFIMALNKNFLNAKSENDKESIKVMIQLNPFLSFNEKNIKAGGIWNQQDCEVDEIYVEDFYTYLDYGDFEDDSFMDTSKLNESYNYWDLESYAISFWEQKLSRFPDEGLDIPIQPLEDYDLGYNSNNEFLDFIKEEFIKNTEFKGIPMSNSIKSLVDNLIDERESSMYCTWNLLKRGFSDTKEFVKYLISSNISLESLITPLLDDIMKEINLQNYLDNEIQIICGIQLFTSNSSFDFKVIDKSEIKLLKGKVSDNYNKVFSITNDNKDCKFVISYETYLKIKENMSIPHKSYMVTDIPENVEESELKDIFYFYNCNLNNVPFIEGYDGRIFINCKISKLSTIPTTSLDFLMNTNVFFLNSETDRIGLQLLNSEISKFNKKSIKSLALLGTSKFCPNEEITADYLILTGDSIRELNHIIHEPNKVQIRKEKDLGVSAKSSNFNSIESMVDWSKE